MKLDLTVVILTFNEELHISRCIASVRELAARILVIDSFSTDRTVMLARQAGADVLDHPWSNHARQLNWALDHGRICTSWVMRLDADEVLCEGLRKRLEDSLPTLSHEVRGLTINRRIYFQGRWIRWGGIYPAAMLRLWRNGYGRCEDRWMDEHIVVNGTVRHLAGDIADVNLNNLTWWVSKHNSYATREAVALLMQHYGLNARDSDHQLSGQARRKRWVKDHVYNRLPVGLRPFLYFLLRYVVQLGFMDGIPGLTFHVLQGFWYRFLVDAKVREIQTMIKTRGMSLAALVREEYGYEL